MNCAPSATRMPHSGVGGRTPRPMKLRPARVEDRPAHVQARPAAMAGGRMLGSRCNAQDAPLAMLPAERAPPPRSRRRAPHVGLRAAPPGCQKGRLMIAPWPARCCPPCCPAPPRCPCASAKRREGHDRVRPAAARPRSHQPPKKPARQAQRQPPPRRTAPPPPTRDAQVQPRGHHRAPRRCRGPAHRCRTSAAAEGGCSATAGSCVASGVLGRERRPGERQHHEAARTAAPPPA
jgi:hypothetical protein